MYGIAKGLLARLELKRGRGGDGDALSGARIAARADRTRSGREYSEAGGRDGLTAGKRIGDGREHGSHGVVGDRLRLGSARQKICN